MEVVREAACRFIPLTKVFLRGASGVRRGSGGIYPADSVEGAVGEARPDQGVGAVSPSRGYGQTYYWEACGE